MAEDVKANQTEHEWLPEHLNELPVALLLINEWQQVAWINRATETLFGYSANELLHHSIEKILPACLCQISKAIDSKRARNSAEQTRSSLGMVKGACRGGVEIAIELRMSRIERNGCELWMCVLIDRAEGSTTEFPLANQLDALVQVNDRLQSEFNEFTYVVSHDLQEPLRKVVSSCQALVEDHAGQLDPPARKWISFAIDAAQRMQRMLAELLLFSRIATQSQSFNLTDVSEVVRSALTHLAPELAESSVKVTVHSLPTVMANEAHLILLFENLISNAIKYRKAVDPFIEIGYAMSASGNRGKTFYFVRDNGIGILPEHFERIFAVFQRLHRREEYSGTGIGLAICKKIIQQHGGEIWVESSTAEGSTFCFTLGS